MSGADSQVWRKCTTCKKPIGYNTSYLICSVSTCNTKRAGMAFCGVECWDAHLPVMNHREAYWEQKKSPKSLAEAQEVENIKKPKAKLDLPSDKPESKNNIIIRKKAK